MIIDRNSLLRAISKTEVVVAKNPTIPILENVMFEIKNNKCTVTGTNIELTMQYTFDLETEDISFCVNPTDLKRFLTELSFDTLDVTIKKKEDEVLSILFEYGLGSEMSFPLIPANEFPSLPKIKSGGIKFKTDFKKLKEIIYQMKNFTGTDPLRPVMNGAFVEIEKGIVRLTATDANKLASFSYKDKDLKEIISFIIPKESFTAISKLSPKDAVILVSERNIVITIDNMTLYILKVNGNYPKWRNVIPAESEVIIKVNKEALEKGLKIASLASREKVVFSITNKNLTLSSENTEFNKKGTFVLPINNFIDQRKEEEKEIVFKVAYNPRFLKIITDAVPPEVEELKLFLNGSRAFVLGEIESNILVLMPVML